MSPGQDVLVTGGAGYIGTVLVPKLLAAGWRVTVLDRLFFGREPLASFAGHPGFRLRVGDIRDPAEIERTFAEGQFDAVIHLAAISNDPCSELDPELTRSVNLTAAARVMRTAKKVGVPRFVYASSASVYGIKEDPEVHEGLPLEPITLYARYKAEGEEILNALVDGRFCGVAVRSATVCGYSPRLRLDLTINILTYHAVRRGAIRVFGGAQKRPNIHIEDLADFYVRLLTANRRAINGRAFNVSTSNATVLELAEMIRTQISPGLPIVVEPTEDQRSYHLSTRRVRDELGFEPGRALNSAVEDLCAALSDGRVPNPEAAVYRNVELMKAQPELWKKFEGGA